MRTVLFIVIGIHGLIHLIGFFNAFNLKGFEQFTQFVSKTSGILWLIAGLFFVATGFAYLLKNNYWWMLGFVAVILSQLLILYFWKDARYGTIVNVIVLILSVIGLQSWKFENNYKRDLSEGLKRTRTEKTELLSQADMDHLPQLVQDYLNYVGVVGKPKVINMKAEFDAEMRGKSQDWFHMTAEQHNFFDKSERLFFLKAKVKGLPTLGYHVYKESRASMLIKLLGLFPVTDVTGEEMFQSETVTLFNDMCFLAPATLIDKRIKWEDIDNTSVKATFTNQGSTISAVLYFNEKGQLIDFVSDDRYDINAMKKYRFSTPLMNYSNINDFNLANYGEAVWHYPEGKFTYGKFKVRNIQYNIKPG